MSGFQIDWDDASFPQIVRGGEQTFTEAKREIVKHFEHERDFARDAIRRTRALRVRDVVEEETCR